MSLETEFRAWRQREGLTGIQTPEEVDQFLAEKREVQQAVDEWPKRHPEISIQNPHNKVLFERFLSVQSLPATEENLERAYEHLKRAGHLELVKIEPPIDPDRPETRAGQWKNGVFRPFDIGNSRGMERTALVGQHDPQASEDEPQIPKRPERMTSAEYAEALRTSKTFRDRENAK